MTLKERRQRVVILKQQLTLLQQYRNHFEDILGKNGVENTVDEILDEILFLSLIHI